LAGDEDLPRLAAREPRHSRLRAVAAFSRWAWQLDVIVTPPEQSRALDRAFAADGWIASHILPRKTHALPHHAQRDEAAAFFSSSFVNPYPPHASHPRYTPY